MSGPLTAEDLWTLPRVGAPVASRDGTVVVVPVTTHPEHDAVTRLHRLAADGLLEPLTDPDRSAWDPHVSPDGARLVFTRDAPDDDEPGAGEPQLHVLPLGGGEARQLTRLPLGVASGARWADDDTLVVIARVPLEGGLDAAAALVRRRAEEHATGLATERAVTRHWDRWLPTDVADHLLRVDVADGRVTDLTPRHDLHVVTSEGGHDGPGDARDGLVAFAATDLGADRRPVLRAEVWTVPLDGSRGPVPLTDPTDEGGPRWRPRFLPDGRVLHGRQRDDDSYASPMDLHATAVDPATGAAGATTPVATALDHQPEAWCVVGDRILHVAGERTRSPLFERPVDGPADAPSTVLARHHAVGDPVPAGDRVLCTATSISLPPQVAAVARDGDVEVLTDVGLDLVAARDLADVHVRHVTGHPVLDPAGDPVQVVVLTPPGWSPDGTWPLVHLVHGGPHGTFGDRWSWRWNAQVFATAGYVVAMVDFHGSTTYGHAFTSSIEGDWMTAPVADVLAATDDLVDAGWVDADRMGLAGGSYGGYLVTQLAAHSDRFRCVVAHAAVTDLPGMYASDDVHGLDRAFGAHLHEDAERAMRASPHLRYATYDTPTLVVHGDRDLRVPVAQGLALYGVLKAKGVEARLLHYPDENHWVLSRANALQWYDEVLGWLARHLRPGA